jgi:hypothetical protein
MALNTTLQFFVLNTTGYFNLHSDEFPDQFTDALKTLYQARRLFAYKKKITNGGLEILGKEGILSSLKVLYWI